MASRPENERKAAALHRLETEDNVWIATASDAGLPHLIPLSLAWDGTRIIVATPTDSPTVRNAESSRRARASLESADDVVLIDGTVEVIDLASADPDLVQLHRDRVGWAIPAPVEDWSFLAITPRVIRAWNSPAEMAGRVIMRHGSWTS